MSMVPLRLVCDPSEPKMTLADGQKLWRLFQFSIHSLKCTAKSMLGVSYSAYGEDVLQEAFLAFSHAAVRGSLKCLENHSISDIGEYELDKYNRVCQKYLISIVMRKCYDCFRKTQSEFRLVGDWADQDGSTDPASELMRQEQANHVQRAAKGLPKHLREVLVLRFDTEYTEKEIAKILGISERMVRYRLRDMLEQMKIVLSVEMREDFR